jgi:hypothetical protein
LTTNRPLEERKAKSLPLTYSADEPNLFFPDVPKVTAELLQSVWMIVA